MIFSVARDGVIVWLIKSVKTLSIFRLIADFMKLIGLSFGEVIDFDIPNC